MTAAATGQADLLRTTAGDVALREVIVGGMGREWRVLHTDAVLSRDDEARFLADRADGGLPYGVALWPAAIALAHEITSRPGEFRGKRVLELGAGTGLPGIVAASVGARVVQTDRQELAMHVCRRNAERNGVGSIENRLVDWAEWRDEARYDWIIGSDILYADTMHPHLRRIFASNRAAHGRILVADPFRAVSLRLMEALEAEGWRITMAKWSIGEGHDVRPVGVFDLAPP